MRGHDPSHEHVEYDLTDWGDQRRQALEMTLAGAGIPFGWSGGVLGVPKIHEDDVDTAIDEIEEEVEDITSPVFDHLTGVWRSVFKR